MIPSAEKITSVLLSEYDSLVELVRLLKEEQICILQRQTEKLMAVLSNIEEQLVRVRQYQGEHEEVLKDLIPADVSPTQPGLTARVQLLPENLREQPLAIAQKIDVQTLLVNEFAWQNHVLLSHSVHFLEQVLAPWLDPHQESVSVYGQNGALQKNTKRQAIFQATA